MTNQELLTALRNLPRPLGTRTIEELCEEAAWRLEKHIKALEQATSNGLCPYLPFGEGSENDFVVFASATRADEVDRVQCPELAEYLRGKNLKAQKARDEKEQEALAVDYKEFL